MVKYTSFRRKYSISDFAQIDNWRAVFTFFQPRPAKPEVCVIPSHDTAKTPPQSHFPHFPYTIHTSSRWIFIHFHRIFHTAKYDNSFLLAKTLFYYFCKIHNYVYLCFEITAYSFIFFIINLYFLNLYYKNTHFLLTIHAPYAILYTY